MERQTSEKHALPQIESIQTNVKLAVQDECEACIYPCKTRVPNPRAMAQNWAVQMVGEHARKQFHLHKWSSTCASGTVCTPTHPLSSPLLVRKARKVGGPLF